MTRAKLLVMLLTISFALPLLGATPSAFPPPIVVVYPLTQTSGTTADAGSNIAILIATKLGQLGGITVKPYTPGTQRPQYLENAIKEDADYYVTGFLTPLGSEISMISQVVSTHSGSVVYSTSISASTYADAAGQADLLHDAILRHAGRGLAALDAPPPPPNSTPEPDRSKGVDITKALRHRQRATPVPSTSPSASASASGAGAASVALAPHARTLVVEVDGDGDAATRAALAADLSKALAHRGIASGYLPVGASEVHMHAKELCAANAGTRVLLTSTLAVKNAADAKPSVELDVTGYDCTGSALGRSQQVTASGSGRDALAQALHQAALAAAEAVAKAAAAAKPGGSG